MIVRINHTDAVTADRSAGWPADRLRGPIPFEWPPQAAALEVLVLDVDEQNRTLGQGYRRAQLRQLIGDILTAGLEPQHAMVVRLDGPLRRGELPAALCHLSDGVGPAPRFSLSAAQRLEDSSAEAVGSLRLEMSPKRLAALCSDAAIGLDRAVRLRGFALPRDLVNPLLDIGTLEDERWGEILPRCTLLLTTLPGLESLRVLSLRMTAEDLKRRLTNRFGLPPETH